MENKKKREHTGLKRKLLSAAVMLLIGAVMMFSATYAWLVLSTAPEVTGIAANMGANGSLEIALLNTSTREDMSRITANVGDSFEVKGVVGANVTWGNLVDLSDPSYGLDQIVIMPSQLQLEGNAAAGYSVRSSSPLALPTYSTDGRIVELNRNTASAVYSSGSFSATAVQSYGVRGIGVADSVSAEEALIKYARSNIITYSGSARNAAVSAINNYGSSLLGIAFKRVITPNTTFNDSDVATLKSLISELQTSFDRIDTAMRYGMLAGVAQSGEGDFTAATAAILNSSAPLSSVYEEYAAYCPEEMSSWIAKLENDKNTLNEAYSQCVALTGGIYLWEEISPIMRPLLDQNNIYIDGEPMSSLNAAELMQKTSFTLSMISGSGLMADIADFSGDFSTWINYLSFNIEFSVKTNQTKTHLTALSDSIVGVSEQSGDSSVPLKNLGGYAIDLAFRCNALTSDLQLQTSPEQRVYSDSVSGDLQGGGSYMQFSTKDNEFSIGRVIELMDAVRVTFIDVEGRILAMAKLNTSNRAVQPDGSVRANLYLYDYTVESDNSITMGERRSGDIKITSLEQNVAKAVTVVVWLDGNIVDNTMVSAKADTSLNGILNLQFSSSADLIPAGNDSLYNSNASRTQLTDLFGDDEDNEDDIFTVYSLGQGSRYTDLSWQAFTAAYDYAALVRDDISASSAQIKTAYNNLLKTFDELTEVSHESLAALTEQIREVVGETDSAAAYADSGVAYTTYTQYMADNYPMIKQVDYDNNLHDEGNGILTPIYTRESWERLALALYDAEAAVLYENATDSLLSARMTALENAFAALDRCVFYEAYDFNGSIYYLAITDIPDTYGKWYDEDFHRVISDLKILELDTGAEKAEVAKIEANDYYDLDGSTILPSVDLANNAYGNFKNDEIIGVRWGITGIVLSDINGDYAVSLTSLIDTANSIKERAAELGLTLDNIAALDDLIAEAQTAVNTSTTKTDSEIAQLMSDFAAELVDATDQVNNKLDQLAEEEDDETPTEIGYDERRILTAAIAEGERLIEEAELYQQSLDELNELIRTANTFLTGNAAPDAGTTPRAYYDYLLDELNTRITAAGGTAQTAYNVITYSLGNTTGYYEPVNRVVLPSAILRLSQLTKDDVGASIITARILTKNGVVYTAEKVIRYYNRAESIALYRAGDAPVYDNDGQREYPVVLDISDGSTFSFDIIEQTIEVPLGDTGETEVVSIPCGETAKKYRWSVSDPEVVSLGSTSSSSATVYVLQEGASAVLTLTVTMDTGSEYTASITLNT